MHIYCYSKISSLNIYIANNCLNHNIIIVFHKTAINDVHVKEMVQNLCCRETQKAVISRFFINLNTINLLLWREDPCYQKLRLQYSSQLLHIAHFLDIDTKPSYTHTQSKHTESRDMCSAAMLSKKLTVCFSHNAKQAWQCHPDCCTHVAVRYADRVCAYRQRQSLE